MYMGAKALKGDLGAEETQLRVMDIAYEQYRKLGKIYERMVAKKKMMGRLKRTRSAWPDTAR